MKAQNKKMRVLLVEDFKALRLIIKAALNRLGYSNVTEVESGSKAQELLDGGNYELVITDYNFSNSEQNDLLAFARNSIEHKTTPFLLMLSEEKLASETIFDKQDEHLRCILKPVNPMSLAKELEAIKNNESS